MNKIAKLIRDLKEKGIGLTVSGSDLEVSVFNEGIDPSVFDVIRENKSEIKEYIHSLKLNFVHTEIPKAPSGLSGYPISDAQRRLWILSQLEDASVAYNMPGSMQLNGEIEIGSFKRAIDSVIERHEVLRTIFRTNENGEVRQWVQDAATLGFKIGYQDLRNEANKEEQIKDYIWTDSHQSFNLEKGPLLRACLLQTSENGYVFYYNMHHIIGDGWSMDVLLRDILSFYESYKEKKEPGLKELRIQYKDYSAWQLSRLEGDSFRSHRAHWLENLKGELTLLDLPSSKKRPEVRTHNGRTVVTYLNKDLTAKLHAYALDREGTLFMGVMTVLKALIYRYTGQQDLILGMQIAGRNHPDLEDQIGFYVNSLVLRSQVSGEESFDAFYQQVKTTMLEAYSHQDYPFDRLVEDLGQSRIAGRNALFDITVVLQNTGEKIGALEIREEDLDTIREHGGGTCIYDIKFDFQEQGDYLRLLVEYNKDVYENEMIEGFIRHFKEFIGSASANPIQPIASIDYLTREEKKNLLSASHEAQVDYPKDKSIVNLFVEQVKEHKQSQALVYGDTGCSYEELNKRSNQVAHFLLKEAGIEKEEKVGLLLTPGLDTISAMLGILKAGGAYVPLDTGLPEERLSFMVLDAGLRVLITQKEFIETANRLQWGIESLSHYLCMDSEDVRNETEQQENVMMSQELWDHVGERAEDQITGGGWLSSYTGKAIPDVEMEEYSLNAYKKLQPSLHKKMRVLEIGCSSGLTLSKVAPEVGFYYGTDLSPVIISNTEKLIAEKGLTNVKLKQLVAHEISKLEEGDFDLVIINSVIQHFHGHNYLLKVITDSIELLKDEGRIFIGDVMDLNKKNDLIEDLEAFKRQNQDQGYTTKTDFSSDLFVSRGYFEDLVVSEEEISGVEISEKIRTIENELTKFRYDAVLHINKKQSKKTTKTRIKHKYQHSKDVLDSKPQTDPKVKITPDQLAYIIYTSGTTGRPKGVMVDHYNVVRLFKNDAALYDFSEKDVWTMFHSYAFDFSVWEMYGALLFGGKLVLVPKLVAQDTGLYLELLEKEGVTILNQTPSAFYNLSREDEAKGKSNLQVRYVIFGGEALSPGRLQHWSKRYPGSRLINMYGITETTVHTTYKEISQEEITQNRSNIGKAIPTVSCLVLDEHKQLVPAGVTGELYVGGAGVARGYLNREELTRERFIAHPYLKGERLYRSGDKVRQLTGGDLEYLGRVDDQVKIRGYRIELGEIEHALLKHPQIEKAVVLAKENQNNEKELVAYITARSEQNTSDLRAYLKEFLAEYMLPSHFVQLAELPLTANGKIDKKALPDPEGLGLSSGIDYVAPRNKTEETLVEIWEGILQRKNIGVRDDFFELGGHSLKAVRLSNAYEKELSVKLSLKDLFANTTIQSHAELIKASGRTTFVQIEKATPQESYPISDAQRRLWVLSQLEDASVAYNMPGHIYLGEDTDIDSFRKAIAAVIERHEVLRTVFRTNEGGEVRQWIIKRENLDFKIDHRDLRKEQNKEERVKAYIAEDAYKVFDLEKGPLLRACLLQTEDKEYVFYYNMHHIIGDGWSTDVLSRDILSCYEAYKEKKEPGLKELKIQYKDYSAWQLSMLEDSSFLAHRAYWLENLKGELPLLDLPGAKKRPDVKTHHGKTIVAYLDKDLTARLRAYTLEKEGTFFMGIMSVLKGLLYRYTGQQDLLVGMQLAGRNHPDLENQIGFYINSLALRSQVSGEESFDTLYQQVKSTMLEAYSHQDYPFDRLVEDLGHSRLASRSAVFDITAILQNMGEKLTELSIPEAEIDDLKELGNTTCKYDIKFDFQEQGDYLRLLVEYNTDVYEKEMIEGFVRHFKSFAALALSDPTAVIGSIDYLTEAERHELVFTLNATQADYPENKTLVNLFNDQVKKRKQNTAILFGDVEYSYEALDRRANQVAHFLLKEVKLEKEEKVGLLLNPGFDTIAAMLGVMKAGGAYVPLDGGLPEERLSFMVSDVGMRVLITQKEFIETANRLQWGIVTLEKYLCVDSEDVRAETEHHRNDLMNQELWDHVGEKAGNQVEGGGWISSYTGLPIPEEEMEEYSLNAYKKLQPVLHKNMRVLEIGCSSGLTLSKVAPEVGFYYGTDLSPVIIANTGRLITEKKLKNVKLKSLAAHEISQLEEGDFDLVIINSVIQSFHGHNYLLSVIRESIRLLKTEGAIFIGDVMDLNKKKDLIEDLETFKRQNHDKGYTTKTDFSSELFVSRAYFEDLKADEPGVAGVEISEKIRTLENELTKFRYDAVLHINKKQSKRKNKQGSRHKWQYNKTALDTQAVTGPGIEINERQLAYVIYTSGTTGRPKGVMLEHGAVVNTLLSQIEFLQVNNKTRGLQFASVSFDASVWETFLILLAGGTLVVMEGQDRGDPALFAEFVNKHAIDLATLPPSYLSKLDSNALKGIRKLITAGEPASYQKAMEHLSFGAYYNAYGPTEASICATIFKLGSTAALSSTVIPIGKPIANATIYIVNEQGMLQPKGVTGEICIGGAGLARGYLNREALTKEKFINDPFRAGGRLYRTGDLGRWLPNCTIEFAGRKDDQVKIRGYRIELGEIEQAILRNEEIREALVLAKENKSGEKELVAYITSGVQQNTGDLRAYLKASLPEYMLPSYYVQLPELPLTANGKVDKKALPDPEGLGLASGTKYVAPRNEVEEKLVAIWETVLQRKTIGVKDDFFVLGGHSLKAVRLGNEYQKELSVKLSLKELFAHTTIEAHAALIGASKRSAFVNIEKVAEQPSYPISDAQRRLWILSQFEEASAAYNMPGTIDLDEDTDIESFKKAIAAVIDRHEVLRTVFKANESGEVRQWILTQEELNLEIGYVDLRKQQNKEERVQTFIAEDSRKPFNLEQGPLLRVTLLQTGEKRYVFYYNMHHSVGDGWSMDILSRDILSYYKAYRDKRMPALEPLRIQYKDYSAWQLRQLEGETFKEHRAYWLQNLKGELPILDLPGKKTRPRLKTFNGYAIGAYVGSATTARLRDYTKEHKGSLFMFMLSAWNVLMYRYTSQKDIVLGTPVSGRVHADLQDQIGFYLNTLAFRNQVDPQERFERFYKRVKDSVLEAYSHQLYPFDRLVEELNIPRDTSRSPVFDILLDFHNTTAEVIDIVIPDEQEINAISDHGQHLVKYDLELHYREVGDCISIRVNFNEDVYEKNAIKKLIRHYQQLIAALVENPAQSVATVDFLLAGEKEQLTVKLNATEVPYPKNKSVIDLFDEQAQKTPDQVAVRSGEKVLNYKELDGLSNKLAECIIQDHRVQPGDLVGIKLGRTEWAVISMLGILKAGAAYVPIDPEYPLARKQEIISGSGIKLLITSTEHLFDEEEFEGSVFAVDVEFDKDKFPGKPVNRIETQASLAYVLYTSGSTGKPKGVMIEHGSLANYLFWALSSYSEGGNKPLNFGLFTSLSFDLTVTSVYLPLLSGSELSIFDPASDISSVLRTYFTSGINCIKLTPAHINLLSDLEIDSTAVQLAIVGGDKLENAQVKILRKLNPQIRICNEYGPTEATVGCTMQEIGSAEEEITIGKPIANSSIYILSEEEQLQPQGVAGEIHIGGKGLARGYLNQETLTAEKFIVNPFNAGERLYKTGDLGRWLPDGSIEFLGRRDEQVKIRGFRVELGEIEHALLQHEQIEEAVVIAREDQRKEKMLVAYLRAQTELAGSDLRNYLKQVLPEWMLPMYYVQLENMPLNTNGKIDKRALPDPRDLSIGKGSEYVAPTSRTEESLAAIWQEVLQRENISIRDDFFTVGGDSIKAIQIVVQIKKTIGKEVRVAELYKYHTIEALADFLSGQEAYKQNEDWTRGMKRLEEFKYKMLNTAGSDKLPQDYEALYPLTPIEQGMIFSSLMNPEEPVYYDQFVSYLQLGDLDKFRAAITTLVQRHSMLRTRYYMESFEEPLKIVFRDVDIPVFTKDLSGLPEDKIKQEVLAITQDLLSRRLKFDNDLLWSMHLNSIGKGCYVIVFCFHHALLDGWSTSIFKAELSQLLAANNQLELPALKSSYVDYTAEVLGRQDSPGTQAYWKDLLAGSSRNKLPFNYKGTRISSAKGMTAVQLSLNGDLLKQLEQVARTEKVSVKSVFLAAHVFLLRILSTETDLITGVVTHNRPELEDAEKIMGCFLYTVPMRVDLNTIKSLRSLVQFVQNYLVDVKPHEAHLTDILRMIGEKANRGNPIFDTLLNFTDFHEYDKWEDSAVMTVVDNLFDDKNTVTNEMTNTYFDLEVDKTMERLTLRIKYVPGYFHEQEIDSALALYVRILEKIVQEIDHPLQAPAFLLPEDKQFLFKEFNATAEQYSKERSLSELFEEQVRRTPEAIALRQDGETLSYRELNEKANQLAAWLLDQGVLPGENIGILVDRSFNMIIGMYAILKSGAAYVPIDPEYPVDRQQYIIENSGVGRVLCDAFYPITEEGVPVEFIALDPLKYRAYPVHDPGIRIDTTQLAYTIYTSGSTGRPKGVMIEHHSAVNLVEWVNKTYAVSASDRLLFITSMCFDLSVYDIFGILSSGGSLVIARREQVQDVQALTALLQEEQITFWDSVPTTLNYLVSELDYLQEAFRQESLRLVFLSGDWIPVQLPERIKNYFPNAQVISLGGATEGTVWSNYYPIHAVDPMWSSIPYGKPISNNYFYILDPNREPVPPGVAGELYIGGVGVARGYANDPAKTKAAFFEDPFNKDLGGRMYRTGDLGRMLPDGNMEFLGREDHQVKIRGFRVELGEIEGVLCRNQHIKEAVVDVSKDKDNANFLIAYYVSPNELDVQELRNYLQDYLPGYMMPSFFIRLEELPLTSNGKINRKALPGPADLELESHVHYVAPRNELEEALAQTWREVLGVEKVGINDNFFDLGGHSLTATRLLTRIEKNFGVKIDLRNLFVNPTISGLSESVNTLRWMKEKSEEVNKEQDEIII